MRALALGGADLVLVPQAGTVDEWPEGLFEAEMRVAAFQNGYYVGLCNRVGADGTLTFAGESFVCTPEGTILARAPQAEDYILVTDMDLSAIGRSHAHRLFLLHRQSTRALRELARAGTQPRPGRDVTFRVLIASKRMDGTNKVFASRREHACAENLGIEVDLAGEKDLDGSWVPLPGHDRERRTQ